MRDAMKIACQVAIFFGVSSLIACGGVESDNGKVKEVASTSDKDGLERYDAVSSAAGTGEWTEVRTVESAHPYTNNYSNSWSISGSSGAQEMRVVFERFETEDGFDFLNVANASGDNVTRHTGTKTGLEVVVPGDRADLRFTSDASVTGWGFRAKVYERRACICPALFDPQCGTNGQTYSNSCAAACTGQPIAYRGECRTLDWQPTRQTVESPHPYTNNLSRSFPVSFSGARQIRVHFSRIDTERTYDTVRILDGAGRMVTEYTGKSTDVTSPAVTGSALTVQLRSDSSVTGWGFAIDRVEVVAGCQANSDCGSGETCNQVQCITTPCFNQCAPAQASYQQVTLAALQANPGAFDGRQIEVVGSPIMGAAACTKIGCSASNPCCNRCSAGFTLGADIALQNTAGNGFTCSGNECTVANSCNPSFPATNAGNYTFRGTFQSGSFGARSLIVDDFHANTCHQTGCSGEVCGNSNVNTACVVRPEFQCYQGATCAAQTDGMCGWTSTPQLQQCLASGGPGGGGRTFASTDTPVSIPDNSATGITSRVEVSGFSTARTVRVSVAITHSYRGDLRAVLTAPNGRERILSDRAGGSFDDLVLENVDVSTLTAGGSANGTWRLRVTDAAAQDTGALNQWSLTIE